MTRLEITAVELANCGPWDGGWRFTFPSGTLAVLVRPNETGKTTLLRSIAATFWGENPPELNWAASSAASYYCRVEFVRREQSGQADDSSAAQGTEQRFSVDRNFATNEVCCQRWGRQGETEVLFRGTHLARARKPDQRRWVEEILPLVWAPMGYETFAHIVLLAQPTEGAVEGRLVQQLVTGVGGVTAAAAKAALVERFREISRHSRQAGLTKQDATNDRELEDKQRQRQQLQQQLAGASDQLAEIRSLGDRIEANRQQIAQAEKQKEEVDRQLGLIEKLRRLQRELSGATEEAKRLGDAMASIRGYQRQLDDAQRQLERFPAPLRQTPVEQLKEAKQRLDEFCGRRAKLLDSEQLLKEAESLNSRYHDVANWPDDAADRIDRYCEAARKHGEARSRLDREQQQRQQLQPQPDSLRRTWVAAGASLVAGLAAAAIGLSVHWAVGVVSAIVAACLAGGAVWALYRPMIAPVEPPEVQRRLREAEEQLQQAEVAAEQALGKVAFAATADIAQLVRCGERHKQYRERRAELARQRQLHEALQRDFDQDPQLDPVRGLLAESRSDWEAAAKRLAALIELLSGAENHRGAITKLLKPWDCSDAEQLNDRKTACEDRRRNLRAEIDRLAGESAMVEQLCSEPAEELDRRVAALTAESKTLQAQTAELRTAQYELQAQLARAEAVVTVNVAQAEVELQWLDEQIERLQRRAGAVAQAHRLLNRAADAYSQTHRQAIAEGINRLMNQWTRRTDRRFALDNDFALSLQLEARADGDEPTRLDVLSQGARDQLALAARVAVLDRVAGDVLLPLLIDDALLAWDQQRCEHLEDSLRQMARRRQVILVTHDERFLRWGRAVQMQRLPLQ